MSNPMRVLAGLVGLGLVVLAAIIFVPPVLSGPTVKLPDNWQPEPGQGEYVARLADCAACHTAPGGEPFAGGRAIESPMGTIWSSNITSDPDTGIGNWSLDEFRAALVDGVGKEGENLYPAMPYENYRHLSERDIRAMYAYFTHEVKPVENPVPETELAFPFNQRWGIRLWKWVGLDEPRNYPGSKAAGSTPVERGAYIVDALGHCGACHSPRSVIMAQAGTHKGDEDFLTGGVIDGWSAPDLRGADSALQGWSDEDLKAYLTTGRNSHTAVAGEMNLVVRDSLQYMTEEDADAVVAYLRTLPDAKSAPKVASSRPADQTVTARVKAADDPTSVKLKSAKGLTFGERIYLDNCSACHMADGRGAPGVFPSLVGNSIVVAKQTKGLTHVIRHGAEMPSTSKRPERLRMPAFGERLNDSELAELETFLRKAWGNSAPAVSDLDLAE